jgi:hypothetical protein
MSNLDKNMNLGNQSDWGSDEEEGDDGECFGE